MGPLEVRRLGLVPYADGLELQRSLVEDRKADRIPDTLLLLQHPHVLTIGVKKDGRSHILAPQDRLSALGVDVFETGRGGDVTYHGPGQLVGYPIIDLNPDRRDVHRLAGRCGICSARRASKAFRASFATPYMGPWAGADRADMRVIQRGLPS